MPAGAGEGCGASAAVARDRLTDAVIDLVLERGYEALGVEELLARAAIPREEFDRRFSGVEDCVLAIVDEETERFVEVVVAAYERHDAWRDGLRAAAYAAAALVSDNWRYVRFSMVVASGPSELARARRDLAVQALARIVDDGRQEMVDPSSVSPGTALAVVGSVYELLQRRLARGGGAAGAQDFVPELMYLAVRPYLGHAEALKELSIPPPREGR